MPKYSTVQAYSDNSSNVHTVSYEQASGAAISKGPVKPEKVVNPYGSTAGANSGDFHLYRQTRAREMERMKQMTQEEQERLKDLEFKASIEKDRSEEEKRTEKKRKKRQRQKEAKLRRKMLAKAGVKLDGHEEDDEEENDFDDFAVPAPDATTDDKKSETKDHKGETSKGTTEKEEVPPPAFPNDGSFLEMMKKQMESIKES